MTSVSKEESSRGETIPCSFLLLLLDFSCLAVLFGSVVQTPLCQHKALSRPPCAHSRSQQLPTLCVYACVLSRVRLSVTLWVVAHQSPLCLEFSKQECWSGLPFPSPGDLPDPRIEPASPALAGGFFTTEPLGSLSVLCVVSTVYICICQSQAPSSSSHPLFPHLVFVLYVCLFLLCV